MHLSNENQNKKIRRRSFSTNRKPDLSLFYETMLSEDQIQMLIMRHLQQIACNVHMVTTLNLVEDDDDAEDGIMLSQHLHCKQEYSVRKEQRQIALALYPTACLLNHACDPDVIVR